MEQTVSPTLLQYENFLTLVDCGFIKSIDTLEESMRNKGFYLSDLTHLILTHHDHDHMGNASEIKSRYPHIQVATSVAEEPYISGRQKSLRLKQAEKMQALLPPKQRAFGEAFCNVLRQVKPVDVTIIVNDGDVLDFCGCEVVATPGHTPGHISLYCTEQKTVIAGDAFVPEDGKPVIANPQFTLDMEAAQASMGRLLALDADMYICYHGGKYFPEG